MEKCDYVMVKERIIVPDVVAVKEQIVVPEAVAVKETVSVPVEVRIKRMPAYHPDPLWPDLVSCPAGARTTSSPNELVVRGSCIPV